MTEPGIYIHIPFCRRKCPYCDFYSAADFSPAQLEAYTEAVCRNLMHYGRGESIDTIYFGGGTPSVLTPAQFRQMLDTAQRAFSLTADCEITAEVNPGTVDRAYLTELHHAGINRLSIGVQSLDDRNLHYLGRIHSAAQAVNTVETAGQTGFRNISCDLMIGYAPYTEEMLVQDISGLCALPVQHISAYLFKIEPDTPFGLRGEPLPPDETCAQLYLHMCRLLEEKGFRQYEISNFAKPGYESRHNLKYWQCVPYLGIGAAAHSCWAGKRFAAAPDLEAFIRSPVQQVQILDASPCGRDERIMLGLRLTQGIPEEMLPEKEMLLDALERAGYIRREVGRIHLTPDGFLVSNSILAELMDP